MASVAQLRQLQLLLWVVLLTVCGGLLADKRACGRVGAAHRAGRVVPHRNNTLSVCCGINARDRSRFTSDSSWNSCGSRGRGSGTNSAGAPGDVRQFMSSTGEVGKRYGPNNFGDIMSDKETSVFGLEEFSPVERIVLTANGNLQRILSAYFGAPITVKINECHRLNTGEEIPRIEDGKSPAIYRREVELLLHGKTVCTALGKITIWDEHCAQAIDSQQVGVGQLFRYLGVLPKFVLIKAGRGPDQAPLHDRELINSTTLWREYELTCPQLQCTFTEIFADEFLSDKAYESSQIAEVPH